jgi:hypothetical protein
MGEGPVSVTREITLYVRLGKGRNRIQGDARMHKPNHKPFTEMVNGVARLVPTIRFAIKLRVPDVAFRAAERAIAEVEVAEEDVVPNVGVEVEPSP